MMHLLFVCVSLVLYAANAHKGDFDSQELSFEVEMSRSDEQTLQMMRKLDTNRLKNLVAHIKTERGNKKGRRLQRRHGQKSHQHGIRQLDGADYTGVLDTMWLLICGTFVFFMHAGFAMLEAGCGRSKNTQAILIKNLITVCMGTLGWYFVGWSLAYGGDVKTAKWEEGGFEDCKEDENPMGCGDGYADNGFIGGAHMFAGSGFLGKGEAAEKAWAEGVIDPAAHEGGQAYMWFFQWAFCTAGASIVSGGIAERVKFPGYMFFSFVMTAFIYPVVVCSTWGYGWLETFKKDSKGNPVGGYIDFAGSGVVHLCGGIGALVGAIVVGKRTGRFDPDREEEFQPHSAPLYVLGTFILWFGWCGFNSGSTLGLSDSGTALVAAHVMMNTTLSAATGGLTVFLLSYAITRKYDCAALCNGILAGLVSITAGCSNLESGAAVLTGLLGGFVYVGSSTLIKKFKIDDPVDASSVHGSCGIWGCLAAALFDFGHGTDKHHGWGGFSATSYEEDGETKFMTTADALAANGAEILFVIGWSGGMSLIVFGALMKAGFLRVDEDTEELGCDHECASPKAYNIRPSGSNSKVSDPDSFKVKVHPDSGRRDSDATRASSNDSPPREPSDNDTKASSNDSPPPTAQSDPAAPADPEPVPPNTAPEAWN
jgi:Amt family ammonium transporter